MKKTNIKMAFCVLLPIIAAVLCHTFSHSTSNVFIARIFDFSRTLIYIGLFSVWGFSIVRRVVHRQTKRILLSVCLLEVFWLVIREFKFRFAFEPETLRHLWYLYYIPTVLVPLLALYISFLLSKPERYRLSGKTAFFAVPSVILIVLIQTNDLHELAFNFPDGAVKTEQNYTYGAVYFLTVLWVVICSLTAFGIMLMKSRLPKNRKAVPLPLIPIAAALIYSVLYCFRIDFVLRVIGDVAVVFCLVFTAFFECCIQSGLIQTNTRYSALFSATQGISVLITDNNYQCAYSSKGAKKFSGEDMRQSEKSPIILESKERLNNMKIFGGHVLWSEDISEILELSSALQDTHEELEELSSLLLLEYEKEKEHITIEEQNRLYDLLQSKTQPQLDRIKDLMSQYKQSEDYDEKQRIIAKILVFGTFIKRRKDFVLSMEYANEFSKNMLSSALGESFRALNTYGIKGAYLINTKRNPISSKVLSLAYDFFEDVVEAVIDDAKYLNFQLSEINGKLRLNILTDCKEEKPSLRLKYPDIIMICEDESTSFILCPEGGDKK